MIEGCISQQTADADELLSPLPFKVPLIPSQKITLKGNISRNACMPRRTRDKQRLDGVARKRISLRQCVKHAIEGLFGAKRQLYHVLKKNLS